MTRTNDEARLPPVPTRRLYRKGPNSLEGKPGWQNSSIVAVIYEVDLTIPHAPFQRETWIHQDEHRTVGEWVPTIPSVAREAEQYWTRVDEE